MGAGPGPGPEPLSCGTSSPRKVNGNNVPLWFVRSSIPPGGLRRFRGMNSSPASAYSFFFATILGRRTEDDAAMTRVSAATLSQLHFLSGRVTASLTGSVINLLRFVCCLFRVGLRPFSSPSHPTTQADTHLTHRTTHGAKT